MLKRTKKMMIIAIILYLLLITWHVFTIINDSVKPQDPQSDAALYLFMTIQPGNSSESVVLDLTKMALLSVLGSGLFIYLKNNHTLINVQQRVGYTRFLKAGIKNTFLMATGISGLTNLYELVLVTCFYSPFVYQEKSEFLLTSPYHYLSTNSLIQILLYTSLSAIGWGIFALLVFSVGLFIRKTPLYLTTGPVLGLVLILTPLLGNIANPVWRTVSFSWFFFTLVAPGQYTFASLRPPIKSSLAFVIAAIIYLTVALLLIRLWYHQQRKRG